MSEANTPEPPYYSVIFTSQRTAGDQGYRLMAERMEALASEQPGFLGIESARDASGLGITVSYWSSLQAIADWRNHAEHRVAQEAGRRTWYEHYTIRIARVERAYGGSRNA